MSLQAYSSTVGSTYLLSLAFLQAAWLLQGGLAPAPLHPLTPGATGCGVLPVVCGARRRGIAANYFLISPLFCGKIKKFFAAGFRTRGGHLLFSTTNFFPRTPIFPVGSTSCGGDFFLFLWSFCIGWRTVMSPRDMQVAVASDVILSGLFAALSCPNEGMTVIPKPTFGRCRRSAGADVRPAPAQIARQRSYQELVLPARLTG